MRCDQGWGVPCHLRLFADQIVGDARAASNGDKEDPWSRLRHEQCSVYDDRAKPIIRIRKGRSYRGEVLAAMRSKRAVDVLQNNYLRHSMLLGQAPHKRPERPERTRARSYAGVGAPKSPIV